MENTALIVVALLLVLLNGFFVASEFAMVKLRGTRVEELRKLHGWRGRILSTVHLKLDAYLSACQLGITLASLGLGWIGEPAFARLIEPLALWLGFADDPARVEAAAFIVAFSVISFLHIVVGELAPKSMAIRRPEAVSLWTAAPLWLFYWGMFPFIWLLNASANLILRAMGLDGPLAHDSHYSREEVRNILHQSRAALEGPERASSSLASHALELPDLHVSDLMLPIAEMVNLPYGADAGEVRELIRRHRYSRYPLPDADGHILGVVHIKDIYLEPEGADYFARLREHLTPPLRMPEDAGVQEVMRRFQQGVTHFALVEDAGGTTVGFLTLEDVLESIHGEITDEHEPMRQPSLRREPRREDDGSLLARGDTALFRIERLLGRAVEGSAEVSTLSGLLMRGLDHVPQAGDVLRHDGLSFEVLRSQGPRAERIRIAVLPVESGT